MCLSKKVLLSAIPPVRFRSFLWTMSVDYSCGEYGKEVTDDDKAIQCESDCMRWFHTNCMNLINNDYDELSETDTIWECLTCKTPELSAVDVFHFDFQWNLPTPKLTVDKQFYLRLLWTYLFGVYSASVGMTTAFMWHELLARREANDIISCLSHFLFHTRMGRTEAKWSVWWADNCPGQNKNNYIMWFFQDLIRRKVYSRVDYKFLIADHTYGSMDQTFGTIEHYTSRIDTVYVPDQWCQHVVMPVLGLSP